MKKEIVINYIKELSREADKTKASQFFKDYLNTISKFHNYSYYNQILILLQNENATKIAGLKTWQKFGRNIKKGEKSIKIIAPIKKDDHLYFKKISVFDISQTEGKDLPDLDLKIEGDDYRILLDKLIGFCKEKNISLEFKDLREVYGLASNNKIVINSEHNLNTQTNTLIHELAHYFLHKNSGLSTQIKEIQAEAVAYVVLTRFNFKTKSFNYLALNDSNYGLLLLNIKQISKGVNCILSGLTS